MNTRNNIEVDTHKASDKDSDISLPKIEIIKSSIGVLIFMLFYQMISHPFLNIDLCILCIVLMVSVNWMKRASFNEEPHLSDYKFITSYLVGGIYALVPNDVIADFIPLLGGIDDVIVIWFILLIRFLF